MDMMGLPSGKLAGDRQCAIRLRLVAQGLLCSMAVLVGSAQAQPTPVSPLASPAPALRPLSPDELRCREEAGFGPRNTFERAPLASAIATCEAVASAGHPDVLAFLGRAYYRADRPVDAHRAVTASEQGGSLLGMLLTGVLHENGYGTPVDLRLGRQWYLKAALGGHPNAQRNLALMLDKGQGGEKDPEQSLAWHRRAADQGQNESRINLALALEQGQHIAKSPGQALVLYKRAADEGHALAQYHLGRLYRDGIAVAQDDAQALEWFGKAARAGEPLALTNLGWMHEMGRGVPKDLSAALRYYREAADKGEANGQLNLGLMYWSGRGLERDNAQAFHWLSKAAEQGVLRAETAVGTLYLLGEGTPQDLRKARHWLEKAFARGDAQAGRNLAYLMRRGEPGRDPDPRAALALLEGLRERDAEARYDWLQRVPVQSAVGFIEQLRARDRFEGSLLMVRYLLEAQLTGRAITEAVAHLSSADFAALPAERRNAQKRAFQTLLSEACAMKLAGDMDADTLERLAALGVDEAAFLKGTMFQDGAGVERNPVQAARWFRQAADAGNLKARNNLGMLLRDGSGVDRDDVQALSLFRNAAEAGLAAAQNNLAWMLERGRGTPVDLRQAFIWFRKAAEQGDLTAQFNVGLMLAQGKGTSRDEAQAALWYRKAAVRGYASAQADLGLMYERGQGVAKDEGQALTWYRAAAEQGHARGQAYLGSAYYMGRGTPRDDAAALAWFRKAAAQQDMTGVYAMGLAAMNGRGMPRDDQQAATWFQKAAAMGHTHAMYLLGVAYSQGKGVPRDEAQALTWLNKAAAEDHAQARQLIAQLNRFQTPDSYFTPLLAQAGAAAPLMPAGGAAAGARGESAAQATLASSSIAAEARPQSASAQRADAESLSLQTQALGDAAAYRWREAALKFRQIAQWRLAAEQVDLAVAARLQSLALLDQSTLSLYGAQDNYFHLLNSSCEWASASRWALTVQRRDVALMLAKHAVNQLQRARAQLHTLGDDIKECFLKVHEDRYRWLADLLIDMGRLGEAEQVLAMLKRFESEEYVRRSGTPAASARIHFEQSAPEREILARVAALHEQMRASATHQRLLALESQRALSPEEDKERQQAAEVLRRSARTLREAMTGLATELRSLAQAEPEAFAREAEFRAGASIQASLRDVFHGQAVAIQMLVLPNRTHLLVTTASTQQVVQVNVSREQVARAVSAMRAAVQSPRSDVKTPAQALYKLLFEPIAPLLQGAQTLMISADDVLRYVPFAALHDGGQYLIERFAVVNYSPLTRDVLIARARASDWRVAAFGATREQRELGFSALPGVAAELAAVVRLPGESTGALPGLRRLDEQFTRENLSALMRQRYPVVHLASHFRLSFGDPQRSVLLLGDGRTLAMNEFSDSVDFGMSHVELLTLSACETAVPVSTGRATGSELESLSSLVHQAGARSVLASLWPVDDKATALFMGRLYRNLGAQAGPGKAQALRQAQLDFLGDRVSDNGEAAPQSRGASAHGTGRSELGTTSAQAAQSRLSHPFYWAPFSLLGHWM